MSEEIDALRAEVAALRDELAAERAGREQAISRRRLMTGLATAGAASLVGTKSASADDGDPLVLGQANTASSATILDHTSGAEEPALSVGTSGRRGVFVATGTGVQPLIGNFKRAIYAVAAGDLAASDIENAITAETIHGFAVEGINDSPGFPTVAGINLGTGPGLAAQSEGHGPQLLLAVEGDATPGPPATYAEAGSIRFDSEGDLWLCTETGTPGTWTRLLREDTAPGRTIPITPFRAIDTRATAGRASGAPVVPGQRKGPLKGGESVTLDLAGVDPIPPTASGIVGTANILSPDGNGYLRIMPAGATAPAASFSWQDGINNANGFTSGLSDTGLRAVAPVSSTVRYHLVIDIAAYIT
jgi:hypothetical protein